MRDLRLGRSVVERICAHATATHPRESCGLVYASGRYRAGVNVQDDLHVLDPVQFSRTAEAAYALSAADVRELLDSPGSADPVVAVVHSHPGGVGAYLSETDRAAAVLGGRPAFDVDQVVVALDRHGSATDIAHFAWQDGHGFIEVDHRSVGGPAACGGTPTPLIELCHLTKGTPARIFVKYEAAIVSGSHKERAARQAVCHAERTGELRPGTGVRLVAPTGGNYGAALARIAAERGYLLTAVVPDDYPVAKVYALRAMGAEVRRADHTLGNNAHGRLATEIYWDEPRASFLLDQFNDVANVWGHYATGYEIVAQAGGRLDCFVAGIGSGAHLTAIGRVLRRHRPGVEIVGVQPAGCDVLVGTFGPHGIPGLAVGMRPAILDTGVITRMESVSDDEARAVLAQAMACEGLSIGLSSAANLAVCLRIAVVADHPVDLVTIAYDRADSYLGEIDNP